MFFQKYQGTGNDFILLDNMENKIPVLTTTGIQKLCDRKFGIGADGLIVLERHHSLDFEMKYYNADGTTSFCGNGARCAVAFANALGVSKTMTNFLASDGEHQAVYRDGLVSLNMTNVEKVECREESFIVDTGSPHFIRFTTNVKGVNVYEEGRKIRYNDEFNTNGINVNFVERMDPSRIRIRTYERGVENETLSCGTGATAAALVHGMANNQIGENAIHVSVEGGELLVKFLLHENQSFSNIQLIGPATFVFKGEINA